MLLTPQIKIYLRINQYMYRCKPYPIPDQNCIIKIFKLKLVLLCQEFEDLCKAETIIVCVFCIMKQVAVQVSKEHRTISKKTVMLIMALHFNKVKLFCNF